MERRQWIVKRRHTMIEYVHVDALSAEDAFVEADAGKGYVMDGETERWENENIEAWDEGR